MYRRSPQKPRYREPRDAESIEFSEESSSSEEEEESDKWTEESEEDTVDTRESQSFQESEGKSSVSDQKNSDRYNNFDKFLINPYLAIAKVSKRDKYTQKNFLSPFPSYLIQPIPREVSGPYFRVSNVMPVTEERAQRVERPVANTQKVRGSIGGSRGFSKIDQNQKERKLCEKHQVPGTSKMIKPEIIKHEHREFVRKLKPPMEMESSSKILMASTPQRPKTSSQEMGACSPKMKNCPECSVGVEACWKPKPKSAAGGASKEKEQRSQGIILSKDIGDGKMVKNKGKEVKEKLVYVVEEEGKSATKIETDIFSLNEILAIKKDLIELSEFAKKLKKLKEMKKDSESDKSKGNPCHCPPAEDLLKDVNKRIEALEARQGALDHKSHSGMSHKGDQEVESKKSFDPKISSTSPPIMVKPSALTTVQSFEKTDLLDSRAEGLPYNSDIINELMDIKFQLEKLEKKRTLKEIPVEATTTAQKEPNKPKAKEHAIAVFSSKTYILTTENFDKAKEGKADGEKTRKARTKENVANWLKNVSLDNDVKTLRADAKKGESFLEQKKRMEEFKCRNCIHTLKKENFDNQEPQKNRASEDHEKLDKNYRCAPKYQSIEETNEFRECKKGLVTSCECEPPASPSPPLLKAGSSGSLPSTLFIKEKLKKLKTQLNRRKRRDEINAVRSKSTTSTLTKSEKTAQNERLKSSGNGEPPSIPNHKKHREKKNEFVKRLEAHFLALAKNLGKIDVTSNSCSTSELLATIDFETNPAIQTPEVPKKNQIVMCSQPENDPCLELCEEPKPEKKRGSEAIKALKKRKKNCDKAFKDAKQYLKRKEKSEKKKNKKCKKSKKGRRCKYCLNLTCDNCGRCSLCAFKCKKKLKRRRCSRHRERSCECLNLSREELRTPCNTCNTDCSSCQLTHKQSCICQKTSPAESPYYIDRPVDDYKKYVDENLLKKFFKNVGGCYPKPSETERFTCGADSVPIEGCLEPEDSECFTCRSPTPQSSKCCCQQCRRSNECSNYRHHLRSPHCHNATELKHLNSCNCIRVFLENRTQPNVKPCQSSQTSKSNVTRKTTKTSDFFVRKFNPKIYYVNHASEYCNENDKHEKHNKHDKHNKHEKENKSNRREECICDKCGNAHRPLKKKVSHKSEEEPEECVKPHKKVSVNEVVCPTNCCTEVEHKKGDTLPLFSFFSHFCRSISRKPKSREKRSEGGKCNCSDKFLRLERRMHDIEKDLDCKLSTDKTHHEGKERKRHKKRKHKEKKSKSPKEKKNVEAYYYTIGTHSLTPSPSTFSRTSKSSGHFQSFNKKINEGLSSLHSFWRNLGSHKVGHFVSTSKLKSKYMESDDPIDDVSRSSRMPRSREVYEFNAEPTSFMKKYRTHKKSKKTKKKEKMMAKSKRGKVKHK